MTETRPGPLASPHGHPDLDTLADFDAGLLDQAQSATLRAHVAACGHCRSILAGIGDIPDLLRRLPPPHIPAAVEARIFAALDAERLARFGPIPAAAPQRPPVPSLAAARERRRRRTRLTSLAAAGLVLIAGGATTVAGLSRHPAPSGGGSTALSEHSDKGAGAAPSAQSAQPDLPAYDRQTITRSPLLIRILNGERGPLAPGSDGVLTDQRLRSCEAAVARAVQGVSGSPAGVQHISFEGHPAYLLLYSSGAGRVLVVVGEGCTGEDPSLLYTRIL